MFEPAGVCASDACEYASSLIACEGGCAAGVCEGDPCTGVTCASPPANACADASTLRTYEAAGTCDGGDCRYTSSDLVCEFGCASGACTGAPCAGVACASPPATYCVDTNALRSYETTGTCDDGICSYASSDHSCEFRCAAGACEGDPCAAVTCDAPPANFCVDGSTLKKHQTSGTCDDGICSYASSDETCTFGCAAGACSNDPCAEVTCETPPANACVDASTVRTYEAAGTCDDGDCSYTSIDTTCVDHSRCDPAAAACTCDPGYQDCDGVCRPVGSFIDCGGSCAVCPSFADASGLVCAGAKCIATACQEGYDPRDGLCCRWERSVIDKSPISRWGALAIGTDGTPHVLYHAGPTYTDYDLNYARLVTGVWQLSRVAAGAFFGPSIVMLPSGQPQAFGCQVFSNDSWPAYLADLDDSGAWQLKNVSLGQWHRASVGAMRIDGGGTIHLAYTSTPSSDEVERFIYARRAPDGTLTYEILTELSTGFQYPKGPLRLDGAGDPHLVFGVEEPGSYLLRIKYARRTAAGWVAEATPLLSTGLGRVGFDLMLDGSPHVCVGGTSAARVLRCATRASSGGAWSVETVEGRDAYSPDLVIDADGVRHLVYKHVLGKRSTNLVYATSNGSGWNKEVLDDHADVPILALDRHDRPHILFRNGYDKAKNYTAQYLRLACGD